MKFNAGLATQIHGHRLKQSSDAQLRAAPARQIHPLMPAGRRAVGTAVLIDDFSSAQQPRPHPYPPLEGEGFVDDAATINLRTGFWRLAGKAHFPSEAGSFS
ncbi:hypothetical protein ACFJIW_20005 [Tahibacter sp. UC22_41]|uniref:hypothetical protein n=1 Tax=Tahibacter sp. UC22_41 TaxID=3350178 RepID=UPI0036D8CDC6